MFSLVNKDYQFDQLSVLLTHRKSHTGFRSVPKWVTLNDLERRNDRYLLR